MTITRREFLQRSALAAAALTAPHPIMQAMTAGTAWAAGPADGIFVLVQLEGGNDGLNMVVPVDGPQRAIYETKRPNLKIPAVNLLGIGDDPVTGDALGLHPSMTALKTLYDAGRVAVVNGVGYPGQSGSHFRSEDIWMGGISSSQQYASGWFGRYLDVDHPGELVSFDCDNTLSPLFFGDDSNVLAFKRLSDFALPDDPLQPDLPAKKAALDDAYDAEATQTTGLQMTVGVSGAALLSKLDDYQLVDTTWPSNLNGLGGNLAARLKQVASIIRHDYTQSPANPTGARFFHVRLGGFDTHTKQGVLTGRQPDLLLQLSQALKAFYDDMVALGVANKTLMMTFSEFGRRVAENGGAATAGTDHGAASPLFVIGNTVVGGVFGRVPALETAQLENGRNLQWHTDFRAVYATIIQRWLNADPVPILGGAFPMQGFLPA
jgi:uncharacterized protein (DUF1501 family)